MTTTNEATETECPCCGETRGAHTEEEWRGCQEVYEELREEDAA